MESKWSGNKNMDNPEAEAAAERTKPSEGERILSAYLAMFNVIFI